MVFQEVIGNCEECKCEILDKTEDGYWFKIEETGLCSECLTKDNKHQRKHEMDVILSWGWL